MIKDNAFEQIKDALRTEYGNDVYITDLPLSGEVSSFPAIAIVRTTNAVNRAYSTFDTLEHAVSVEYTVDVYTNDIEKKDEQAEDIMEFICDKFTELNFYRDFEGTISNLLDSSITRRNARFTHRNITKK